MSESKILKGLNFEQKNAASVINGPACINAGPGSGKTRTLTHSVAYRIEQGAEPRSIVAITFTNKAKDEIKDRLVKLLGDRVARNVFVGTYHAFLSINVLMPNKRHPAIKELGYLDGFVIADSDESDKILDEAIKEMPVAMKIMFDLAELKGRDVKDFMSKHRAEGKFADTFIQEFTKNGVEVMAAYRGMKVHLQALESLPDSEQDQDAIVDAIKKNPRLTELCKISAWRSYERRMKNLNAVDYDGMLVLSKYLLERDPVLRKEVADDIRHILLDEFQDTNTVQWDCMKLIIDTMASPNVFVVGDPDQCIYQFRSANPQIMRDFDTIFPDAKMLYLTTNYRSTAENVAMSNVVKTFINPRNAEHPMQAFNKSGELPTYRFFRDEKEEAEYVINGIKQCLSEGIEKDKIAVLYRGKAQRKVVENALTESHLPYVVVGDISFYETKEVKDVISMLRMIANETDILGFARGISASSISVNGITMRHEIEAEKRAGKELTPMQYLYKRFTPKKITPAAKEKMMFWVQLRDLIAMKKSLSEEEFIHNWMVEGCREAGNPIADTLTVEQAMQYYNTYKEANQLHPLFEDDMKSEREKFHTQVVDRLKSFFDSYYKEKLISYSEKNDNKNPELQEIRLQERLDNVEQIFATLHAKLMENGSFEQSINDLMLLSEQAEDNEMDGIQLMTVHASKGLEFDTVFLVGSEQRSYFSQSTVEDDFESEACAFFVATSRAERKNFITGAKGRTINGQFDTNTDELIFIKTMPAHAFINETSPDVAASARNNQSQGRRYGHHDDMSYLSEINNYSSPIPPTTDTQGLPKKEDGRVDLGAMIRRM